MVQINRRLREMLCISSGFTRQRGQNDVIEAQIFTFVLHT